MISIDFTRTRAQATRDTQVSLAAPPTNWNWSQKTVVDWDTDIAALAQLVAGESTKHTQWRNAAELWQSALDALQQTTRQVVSIGRVHFRNDAVKRVLFESLRTDAESRSGIFEQAMAAKDLWQEVAPAWEVATGVTVGGFGSALSDCQAKQAIHSAKFTAWRLAATSLTNKAQSVDEDCIAWFAEATRRFPAGTVEGDFIRSSVPTTTRPEPEVEQAVISNLLVSGGEIHFDVAAEGATRFTFLQQSPGSPAFVVVLADSPEAHLSLTGQPAGWHRFKAFGSNSGGSGPESAIVEATVSVAAAA